MAKKQHDETDDFFSKLQTGSDDARVLWADISRDKLFVGRQLNQIFNQKRSEIIKATGATEDMRELNQLYGKMELLGFLTTNLLAYPAMFAESKGMVYRPNEGADVIPITPNTVWQPNVLETKPYWPFRPNNAANMPTGELHTMLMNELRTPIARLFYASSHYMDNTSKGLTRQSFHEDILRELSRAEYELTDKHTGVIKRIDKKIAECQERIGQERLLVEDPERTHYADEATVQSQRIMRYVQKTLLPEMQELNGQILGYIQRIKAHASHIPGTAPSLPSPSGQVIAWPKENETDLPDQLDTGQVIQAMATGKLFSNAEFRALRVARELERTELPGGKKR
jgi:hypothetical protein